MHCHVRVGSGTVGTEVGTFVLAGGKQKQRMSDRPRERDCASMKHALSITP